MPGNRHPYRDQLFYLVTSFRHSEHMTDTHVTVETVARTKLWASDGASSGATPLLSWQRTEYGSYELRDPLDLYDRYNQIP